MKLIHILIIIFVLFLTSCDKNSSILTLEDITSLFWEAELHIKPQVDDEYPELNGVEPTAYELLDEGLYFYVFNSEKDLGQALESTKFENKFKLQPHIYQAKNILILYFSFLPSGENFEKRINDVVNLISTDTLGRKI